MEASTSTRTDSATDRASADAVVGDATVVVVGIGLPSHAHGIEFRRLMVIELELVRDSSSGSAGKGNETSDSVGDSSLA
jgi:hypothetical protein